MGFFKKVLQIENKKSVICAVHRPCNNFHMVGNHHAHKVRVLYESGKILNRTHVFGNDRTSSRETIINNNIHLEGQKRVSLGLRISKRPSQLHLLLLLPNKRLM